jgi:hypothetical protein
MTRTLMLAAALAASLTLAPGAAKATVFRSFDLSGDSFVDAVSADRCVFTHTSVDFSTASALVHVVGSQHDVCTPTSESVDVTIPFTVEGDFRRAHVFGSATIGPDDSSLSGPGTMSFDVTFEAVGPVQVHHVTFPCDDIGNKVVEQQESVSAVITGTIVIDDGPPIIIDSSDPSVTQAVVDLAKSLDMCTAVTPS